MRYVNIFKDAVGREHCEGVCHSYDEAVEDVINTPNMKYIATLTDNGAIKINAAEIEQYVKECIGDQIHRASVQRFYDRRDHV